MKMDSRTLSNLVDCRIVEIRRRISGDPVSIERAIYAPTCVQVHAMSGLVFHVMYSAKADQFKLTEEA